MQTNCEASQAGRQLSEYVNCRPRAGRTVLEVLEDFRSATPPLAWLLQAVPRLRPRLFSISSSLAVHPGQAHVTAAIVDWATPFKRRRRARALVRASNKTCEILATLM